MEGTEALFDRLRAIGLDPDAFGDPADAWRALRERFGPRITLVDRYDLEAAARGIRPEELPSELRARIGNEVLLIQFPGLEFVPSSERSPGSPIDVVPYDRTWPTRFVNLRRRLVTELGPVAVRVEHVGSTAVPGLAAKPIVDVQVSVADVEAEATYLRGIERVAAPLRSREPGHRYFRPAGNSVRDVHVHVCNAGSTWERDHLLFRDYLRAHPDARDAYGLLKSELASRYGDDRLAYTDAKSTFILDSLDEALEWAAKTDWKLPRRRIDLRARISGGRGPQQRQLIEADMDGVNPEVSDRETRHSLE